MKSSIFTASSDVAETLPVVKGPADTHGFVVTAEEAAGRDLTFKLPFELTNGNDGRGSKWFSSAKLRKTFEHALRGMRMVREPFPYPVNVHVIRILGPKQSLWDSSSIGRGNWKEIEDALVACGWFHDDGPKYIRHTNFYQDATRRKEGPCIVVSIIPAH